MIPEDVSADIEIEKYEDIEILILIEQWKDEKRKLLKIELVSDDNK